MTPFVRVLVVAAMLIVHAGLAPAVDAQTRRPARTAPTPPRQLERLASDSAIRTYLQLLLARESVEGVHERAETAACVARAPMVRTMRAGSTADRSAAAPAVVTGSISYEYEESVRKPLFAALVSVEGTDRRIGTKEDGSFAIRLEAALLHRERPTAILFRSFGTHRRVVELRLAPGDSVVVDVAMCEDMEQLSIIGPGLPPALPPHPARPRRALAAQPPFARASAPRPGGVAFDAVQRSGEHLVILRRGRLFTVATPADSLAPVAAVDAFAPGIDPDGALYDELFVHEDKAVVLGYSGPRGGIEINTFRVHATGRIEFLASHLIKANDPYSSRGTAAWMIDGALVLHTTLAFGHAQDPIDLLPEMRRWNAQYVTRGFEPVDLPTRVYRTGKSPKFVEDVHLHAMNRCVFDADALRCESSVFVGPAGSVVHRARNAIYLWTASGPSRTLSRDDASVLFRVPLDGTVPSAVDVRGSPVDADGMMLDSAGVLHAIVEQDGDGAGMDRAESEVAALSLVRIPASAFGDADRPLAESAYRPIPWPYEGPLQNRFIGRHAVYGTTGARRETQRPNAHSLFIVSLDAPGQQQPYVHFPLEALGTVDGSVVATGKGGGMLLTDFIRGQPTATTVEFERRVYARVQGTAGTFGRVSVLGPSSLLAFTHRADSTRGPSIMVYDASPGVRRFIGTLSLEREQADDACRASCVARAREPRSLMEGQRFFAVLGYELVEAAMREGRLVEVRRVNFLRPPGAR